MPRFFRGFYAFVPFVSLFLALASAISFAAGVKRGGSLASTGTSEAVAKAVEDTSYDVELDDGWTAQFWFSRALATASGSASGALYHELSNGEFVAVVRFPKGFSDFRGQAVPSGTYTLRYQYLPQDANHMGVSPNPDFLLAIPASDDPDPDPNLALRALVKLSAKASGTAHPAVIALAPAGDAGAVTKDDQGMTVLTIAVPSASKKTLHIGIVVKGQATQ